MTTAQYLFQTKVNPDVVYKSYLKWLGMLTPSDKPVVHIESERFLLLGFTYVEPYCSPVDGLNYGADGIGSLGL